jgi:hypothetical protein
MSRALFVALLWIEAAVCFGPVFFVLLLGILIFPVWVTMILAALAGIAPWNDGAGGSLWDAVWAMVFVLCGLIGVVGLVLTLVALSRNERPLRRSRATAFMVAVGLVGLACFNLRGGAFPTALPALLAYYLLPGLGSAHILYLARQLWLPAKAQTAVNVQGAGT